MSIASALNNATTGLMTSARAVQVASSNVANAMTEGYAPRRLELAAASLGGIGGGVRVAGITRLVDPALLGLHRDSKSADQGSSRLQTFWQSAESIIGLPGDGVNAALTAFETALISASERPDLDSRLQQVVNSATALAESLATVQDNIQSLRTEADTAIARDVATLNDGLARIDALNTDIVRLRAAGQSTLGLEDDRQALITSLSEIVPMREFQRSDGRVTLFTGNGRLLLDLNPQEIGFSATPALDPAMTSTSGLSGLTIGDIAISTGPNGPMAGGRLAANFAIRDTTGPGVQEQIDTIAADLITRFEDPATDPTLALGLPGLFTENGTALSASPAPGLAGRLGVNPLVDPGSGGALWRVRDGLGAAAPGPSGDAAQIGRLLEALSRPVSAAPGLPAQSLAESLADIGAQISTSRHGAENTAAQDAARYAELTERVLETGVDTDAEMQRLLSIETAYAANARVIETADLMLQRLLEI